MTADLPLPSALPPVTFVGAGKLGTAVAEAWAQRGGSVASRVTAADAWEPQGLVFEATAPDAAVDNLTRCIEAQVPVVTGTTGWLERLDEVRDLALRAESTAFYSTNFSPGVHALNAIAKHAAGVFNQIPGYAPHIREVHHVHKKDAPSGTALTLAEHVTDGGWTRDLPIESVREGEVVGLHALAWDSAHDAVVLQHEAKTRAGFAEGAVWALCWTWKRHVERGFGLYTMTDLFQA